MDLKKYEKYWKIVDMLAIVLLLVGGLNWLFAVWNFNLVTWAFGSIAWLVQTVYVLIGLSAVWFVVRKYTK